jgi:hypothetical protein
LIDKLRLDGRAELAEAAECDKPLHEAEVYESEQDLFILCEKYISDIEALAKELQQYGVMS